MTARKTGPCRFTSSILAKYACRCHSANCVAFFESISTDFDEVNTSEVAFLETILEFPNGGFVKVRKGGLDLWS